MDLSIKAFSDEGTGIAQTIRAGIRNFSRNPRDVKRYVNSFRFYYFLRSARMARQEEAPSIGQLSRWILLSLRWPGIIRWLRSTESISNDGATTGLGLLAEAAVGSADVANWAKSAALIMGLNEKEGTWLADQDLFAFFSGESSLPDAEKLSSSAGKGLW